MCVQVNRFTYLLTPSITTTDLAADVPVGESDDHPVLGGVVLVLVLHNQPLPGVEVSFPL